MRPMIIGDCDKKIKIIKIDLTFLWRNDKRRDETIFTYLLYELK